MTASAPLLPADAVRIIPGLFGEQDFHETHAHRVQLARQMAEMFEGQERHERAMAEKMLAKGNVGAADRCEATASAAKASAAHYRDVHARLEAMTEAAQDERVAA